jgi:signal transduction histidine kinase
LLMNSIKYTRSGQIELSYRIVHNNTIQFIVKDSGTGIREDILPKLFDSFYQVDRKVDGTGLGLSIVRGLTELLGGTVELRTIIGGGTTFYVNIPYKPICPLA